MEQHVTDNVQSFFTPHPKKGFSSKQAEISKPERKSTVRVVQSRPETMAPFITRGRWGLSKVQRNRDRARATLALSLFAFAALFAG